jgi:CheY-like chemotaxis protein
MTSRSHPDLQVEPSRHGAVQLSDDSRSLRSVGPSPQRHCPSVLIIEPYPPGRRALERVLLDEGLQPTSCETRSRALTLARTCRFDGIVTDVVFPDRTPCGGFIGQLNQLQPQARLVVVSGMVGCEGLRAFGVDDCVARALRNGAHACLPKPIVVSNLVRELVASHSRSSSRGGPDAERGVLCRRWWRQETARHSRPPNPYDKPGMPTPTC